MDPKGKIALATGGGAGIGLSIVKELLQQGVQGVSICDINVTKSETEVKQLQQQFGENKVIFIKADVTKEVEIEAAFKQTIKHFGCLDIVVNNAGICDDKNFEHCVSINVTGAIRTAKLALKYMGKDQGGKGGVLMNTGSISGLGSGLKISLVYNATKHAVIGMTRSLGSDYILQRTGVRTVCICPGYTTTEIISTLNKEPVILTVFDEWMPEFLKELQEFGPPQRSENVSKAVLQMIREAKNGALWVVEGDQPPYEINIPPYANLKV